MDKWQWLINWAARPSRAQSGEFGRADLEIVKDSALFAGIGAIGSKHCVWMSHGDLR